MVEIKIIKSKSQIKEFFKFADCLYANCDLYVPELVGFKKKFFSHKHNPNLNSNEIVGFLAIQEGKVAGRILGIANRIEAKENGVIRFSHMDFINDTEVSFALFDAIKNWAKSLKIYKIIGAMGFNDFMSMGCNTSSDYLPTMLNSYNFDYYIKHLKEYGFVNAKKFNDYVLTLKDGFDEDEASFDIYNILKKNNWKIVEGSKKFKIEMYRHKINELAYSCPLTPYPVVSEDNSLTGYLKTINKLYDTEDLNIIINENDDIVGTMLISKNSAIALQVTAGKVLNSKLMYTVKDNNQADYDMNWLIINKSSNVQVMEVMSLLLAKSFKNKDINKLHTNLWINSDSKVKMISKYFEINKVSERAIFEIDITEENVIVNRTKSDLAEPKRRGDTSELK